MQIKWSDESIRKNSNISLQGLYKCELAAAWGLFVKCQQVGKMMNGESAHRKNTHTHEKNDYIHIHTHVYINFIYVT
jgi:hypothetical protein